MATTPASSSHTAAKQAMGAFQFVLHSHLPYCRRAGRWPHGEEWLHEALAETYIPLLNVLYDLQERGVAYHLTVSLTPVLVEQLADFDVCENFVAYLDEEIEAASRDASRFSAAGDMQMHYLATFYYDFYQSIKQSFEERFNRDVIGAFRRLQDMGCIEISTSAATHGYLPLLSRDSSIYAQICTAITSYQRHFGRPPRVIWLPECAYRPASREPNGTVRPGLESFLASQGLHCFFVEASAIEQGKPSYRPRAALALGPYAMAQQRFEEAMAQGDSSRQPNAPNETRGTTYRAYIVAEPDGTITNPPVAAIGRNERTGMQVWSAEWGYPGDADYREFHRKDPISGLQYWRITGPNVDLKDKDAYHPDWADGKILQHADHFATLVADLLADYHAQTGEYGLISSHYDTELFGHWWFEGVRWLGEVLARLAANPAVDLVTTSMFLNDHTPTESIVLPEGSWGAGGSHWTWDNPDTHWMWPLIHEAEARMERLVALYPNAEGDCARALNQAAREILLLESSDWPFLITTGQAREYAISRFNGHLGRFQHLADALEAGQIAQAAEMAAAFYELDKVFPDIDYRWFTERQGRAD